MPMNNITQMASWPSKYVVLCLDLERESATFQRQLSDAIAANALLIAENRRLREPDGYVVVKSDGHYVGAWLHKDVAESVVNRSQSIKDERIAPFKLLESQS